MGHTPPNLSRTQLPHPAQRSDHTPRSSGRPIEVVFNAGYTIASGELFRQRLHADAARHRQHHVVRGDRLAQFGNELALALALDTPLGDVVLSRHVA